MNRHFTFYIFGIGIGSDELVGELKYGVSGDLLITDHVTQPNFGPKIGLKRP